MQRTPPESLIDFVEAGPSQVLENPVEAPPKQKLAAVTREQNVIQKLFSSPSEIIDHQILKSHFNEYLVRVEALYSACGDKHQDWLSGHKIAIDQFRSSIEEMIHPMDQSLRQAPRSVSNVSRTSSTASSAVLKLAQERAKLKAKQDLFARKQELKREELSLQLRREEIELEQESRQLGHLEEEFNRLELGNIAQPCQSPQTPVRLEEGAQPIIARPASVIPEENVPSIDNSPNNSGGLGVGGLHRANSTPNYTETQDSGRIINLLQRQTDLTDSIARCQQYAFLPKKELQKFDGTDITAYKRFMINFNRIIERECRDDGDKLLYLQQFTSGYAKKIVDSCVHYDARDGYNKAISLLNSEYNNEYKVANCYIHKLENWPIIKTEDSAAISELSLFLLDCHHYLENMSTSNQMNNPKEIMGIVRKLPYRLQDRFRRKTSSINNNHGGVSFRHLVDFVREEADVLKQPIFGTIGNPAL